MEEGREKCATYLPNKGEASYGPVKVSILTPRKTPLGNPAVWQTEVRARMRNQELGVTHFLYDGWF